jgi:hypothetical protein
MKSMEIHLFKYNTYYGHKNNVFMQCRYYLFQEEIPSFSQFNKFSLIINFPLMNLTPLS